MKLKSLRIFAILSFLFVATVSAFATGSAYTRASIYLKAGSPTAAGKVYVGTAATSSPAYKNCTSTTTAASTAKVEGANKSTTYHFYAQANSGYKFTGWYSKNSNDEYTFVSADTHYSVAVKSGAAPSGTDDSYTDKDLYASFIKIIQLSFVRPTNGYFTITHNGAAVSDYSTFTVDGQVVLRAYPDAGYRLKGWYTTTNGGTTKTYFAFGDECEPNFTDNTTIGAEFEPDDGKAQFWVQGTNYVTSSLTEANTKAASASSKKIVVVNSGSIPSGTYTISSGVTLLIPYGSDYSKITEPNNVHITGISSAPALKVYKKLTLSVGATINCSGNICVGGQVMAINGGNPTSLVRGSVGVLDLSLGGTVNLKSGSKLYAWGFVQEKNMNQGNNTSNVGEIIAESGSYVYEVFQCGEWRGGTASSTIYNNRSSWKFFPFQSYTIQNIEAPITIKAGATETCYWTIFGDGKTYSVTPVLIGSSGLFVLSSGASLKKWYDPTTDRVCYSMSGTASLGAITLNALGTSITSSDYNLPIPANMHIVVNSGTTTISKPMVMHAGSVVEIKLGGTLTLNSNVYMFDKDDWDTYCMYAYYFRNYANLTAHYDRDATNAGWNYNDGKVKTLLEDARLVVDGTLKFGASGRLYSSTNGSAVVGNGGGQVQFTALPGATTIVMCKQLSDNVSVSVSSANLCNDDNTYTKAIAATTFYNVNGRWFQSGKQSGNTNKTYDFTYIKSGAVYGTGGTNATVLSVYSHDKTGILDRMKWANVKADVCDNWFAGLNDTYLYNYTLNNAWHQFQPTGATIGEGDEVASIYSGSDNKLYTKLDCTIDEYGGTDANCLYTVGGVKKAFVNGAFVALVKNTDDEAYHKSDAATTYYICFSEGCNWHPATKVASTNKAYTVEGQDYIWYNGEWIEAIQDGTFYYSLDENNVRIYYEYVDGAWTLASPVAETTRSGNTLSWFKIADAFADANTGTGPGTATTIKLLKNVSVSTALNYTGNGNTILDLNGFTLTSSVNNMITINAASAVLIVIDQSSAGTGKVQLSYSANSRRYAVSVTKGHFILNSGTVSAINTMSYDSSSAKTVDVGGVTVASGHKFTMNGGRLEAISDHNPYGVNIASSTTSVITVNGGTIEAKTTERSSSVDSPYGIYGYGKIIVNGGTIKATCYRSSSSRGISVLGSLEMKGGSVIASGTSTIYGVHVGTATTPTATITGGTITATATGGTVRGVISYGTTTISGGTINATAGTSDARGVFVYNTSTTINAGATINASANSDARALYYGSGTPTVIVNGGTFNATTNSTTGAYGVYAEKGTGTINDGEFIVTAKTNTAYGMFVATANTPTLTVNGGKFKVLSNATSPTNILLCNSAAATANFVINGGYYNLAANENVTTGTDDGKTIYPNLSIAKYKASGKVVKELDATVEASLISAGYGCKVAGKEYTVTWCKMGGNTGSNILKKEKWESGKVPVWTGADPDLNSTGVTRVFAGWNTEVWNRGTSYPLGTPLPAITDHDVTYYAINKPVYAEVIANGTTTQYYTITSAWSAAMAYTNATIRVKTQLGTEASISNGTQLVFNPTNANSTITLDLNGLSWTMGNHSTASNNVSPYLSVAPTKANCKLIITDNSASGNGYLMNKHAYAGTLYCVDVANGGELILQGGGLRVSNTSDISAVKYGVGVNVASGAKFTMTGGTIYSTDVYSPRGMNVSSGGTADIAGGTIEANSTTGHAYAILPYGTVSVGGTAIIKAVSTGAAAYAAQTQGTLNIDGGTIEAKAASNARGLFAYLGGKITVDGNPTIKAEVTSGSEAYPVYSHTTNSEVVINGGSFTSTGISTSGSIMGVRTVSDGVVTVNDGTFTLNGGSNWTFGAFANGGTVNLNGGTFNVNQASGGNVEAVRVYPDGTCNISGGTYTVNATANKTNGNALCAFGGTANITGNPVFTAYKGIDIATAVVANGDLSATVSVDGGTYITSSYALRSIKTTRDDSSLKGSITGDLTVWDGRFYSGSNQPINTSSGTSYLKIRGGYYSTYTSSNVSNLTQYVVSPSTAEAYATTIDGKAYTYRVNTKYNVTFSVNGTNTVKQYNRNETPDYGSTPAINDGNTYEFTGWSPEIAPVTTDVTYTAVFKKYEAEVIEGEATSGTKYEHFADAWAEVQLKPVAKIKLLSNVSISTQIVYNPSEITTAVTTLDLNNHTLAYTGTDDRFVYTNKAGSKLIIADNSTQKKGVIKYDGSRNGALICVATHFGDLELQSGTIYSRNAYSGKSSFAVYPCRETTFTMTGGTINAYGNYQPCAIRTETGTPVVNVSGGTLLASTEYDNSGTPAYTAQARTIYIVSGATLNITGNPTLTAKALSEAYCVFSYQANTKFDIQGGTFNATATGGSYGVCVKAENQTKNNTISGGTFNAISEAGSYAVGAWVVNNAKITVSGGTFTAKGAGQTYPILLGNWASDTNAEMEITGGTFNTQQAASGYNFESVRAYPKTILKISGGTFTNTVGNGLSIYGGTTTISGNPVFIATGHVLTACGAFIGSIDDTADISVNGGTFISTNSNYPLLVYAQTKEVDGVTKTQKANIKVNGGYFFTANNTLVNKQSGASTIVLNGGKYNESSGTNHKTNITNYKGATTTVTDITESKTVGGTSYAFKYELKTPFTVTWNAGTSYTKTETLQSGVTPSNTECTTFVRNDTTFYFTNWTPTPAPVYSDITYNAEGTYYEAKVKIGTGAWTNYEDFLDAWNAVQNSTNATTYITLLNNVELADKILHKPAATKSKTTFDLNNFTLSVGGTVDRLLEFNKTDAILTITDNSTDKGGTLSIIRTSSANIYTTYVYNGELKMTGGRIYVENNQNDANWHPAIAVYVAASDNAKLTMTGGTVESKAKYCAYTVQSYGITNITGGTVKANSPGLDNGSNGYAIVVYAVQRTTTIGGTARIEATGLMSINGVMATGWISNDGQTRLNGTLNITGGTIDVTATAKNACGVQANATSKTVDDTNYGAHGIVNISGGTFNVKCAAATATQVFAVQVHAARVFDSETPHHLLLDEKAEANISGGTFLVDSRNNGAWVTNGGNVDLLRNWGTLNVSGGTFTIYQRSTPVGVASYRNKATISGNPVFNINSYVTATGVEAGPWNSNGYCDADAANNLAEIEVNGGTFNVKTESDLSIGAWSRGGLDGDSKYAMNAKVTVNGGEFVCINPTAGYSRIFRQENTRTGTYGSATAQILVTGGKFKPLFGTAEPYSSTGTHNVTLPDNNDKRTVLTGGYYVHNTELATFKADTCKVTALTSSDTEYANGYRYKIETNYVAKVQTGSVTKYFTTVLAAMNYAKTVAAPTITMLDDAPLTARWVLLDAIDNWQGTFDLNGKTVTSAAGGMTYGMIDVTKAGIKLTIKDSSTGGKLLREDAGTAIWGINIDNGATLELQSGTIYVKNTKTDITQYTVGVCINTNGGTFNLKGGNVEVHAEKNIYGLSFSGTGTANLSGGELSVNPDLTSTLGSNTYAIRQAVASTVTVNGTAKVSATANDGAYSIYQANGTLTLGGTADIDAEANINAYGLYSSGSAATATVSGGTITTNTKVQNTGASNGVYVAGGANVTISGGTVTSTTDGTSTANIYAVKTAQNGTLEITGGTFNGGTDGNKYQAVNIRGGNTTISGGTFNAATGVRAMDWADAATITGVLTISGGTFNCTASVFNISSMANTSRDGHVEVTVNGGKFKTTGSSIITFGATPSGATASSLTITGGYFNEKSGTTFRTQIATYVTSPNEVIDLNTADVLYQSPNDYRYTVLNGTIVASVRANDGTTTYYTTVAAAITAANALTNPTVTILRDASVTAQVNITAAMTIDLNGKTVSGTFATAKKGVFAVSAADKTVTITDSGTGGKIDHTASINGVVYGVNVTAGTLNLVGGTVYAKNTTTGTETSYRAYGIYSAAAATTTISGGRVEAWCTNSYAMGICAAGDITMTGGTVYAEGTTGVYGIYSTTNATLTNATVTAKITKSDTGVGYLLDAKTGTLIINSGTYSITGGKTGYTVYATNAEGVSVTISSGKFSGTTRELYKGTKAAVSISGGYYVHDALIEANCAANHHVLPASLTENEITYNYKVAESYSLTWTTDGDALTGDYTSGYTEPGTTIVQPSTPTKTGYTFKNWGVGTPATVMPSNDLTYTATWTANTNTAYTVKHMREALDGTYPESLTETENLTGTTAASVTPAVKTSADYTGFTVPATQTKAILADGSLVIEYKYTRNSYTLTWALDGGTVTEAGTGAAVDATGSPSTSVKFGATFTAPTVTRDGYHFDGWNETPTSTMPAEDKTYTAQWTLYVAEVTINGTTTPYTTLADAFAAANAATGGSENRPKIKILQDVSGITEQLSYTGAKNCTLDLNGHTVAGTVNKLLNINKKGITFTITDNSAGKAGEIKTTVSSNARIFCVAVTKGTLTVEAGKIYAKNSKSYNSSSATKVAASAVGVTTGYTLNVNGGTLESEANYQSCAIYGSSGTNTYININGGLIYGHTYGNSYAKGIYTAAPGLVINSGEIKGESAKGYAYGVHIEGGSATVNGGTLETVIDTVGGAGTQNAYGIYVASGSLTIPESSTANVKAIANTKNSYGVYVGSSATADIAGGTFLARTKTSTTAMGVASYGTTEITGGTFTALPVSTYAYGVYCYRGTTTVSGTADVTAKATGSAFVVTAGAAPTDAGVLNNGSITINGGQFKAETTSAATAYGVYVYGGKKDVSTTVDEGTVTTHYASAGSATVNGGEFTVTSATTSAIGIAIAAASYTNGDATATPTATITGGKFNVTSGTANNNYATNTKAAATSLLMQGGWYNINTNLAKYIAPTKTTSNYYEFPLTDATYKYEVAQGYSVIFKDGDGNTLTNPAAPRTDNVWKEGTTPTYTGSTPTKTQTQGESYTFNSWSPAIVPVATAATYIAQFDVVSRYFGEQYRLDIIDYAANGTNKSIKINMNTYLVPTNKTQWTVQANDATKYKNATATRVWDNEDHALTIPSLTLTAGDTIVLSTYDGVADDATCLSRLPYTVPEIITANKTITYAQSTILFVRSGTLTIDGNITYDRVFVNPGAKLVINSGKTLTVNDRLVLRTQAQAGTAYAAPELQNNGTLTFNGDAKMYYSRIVSDKSQTYPLGFPFSVDLTQTKFSNGKTATKGSNYGITFYNSENRALYGVSESNPNWDTFESSTLQANQGYQIVSASDYYYEILFPVVYTKKSDGETVNVVAPGNAQTREFDRGWNYIVQPYTYTFDCHYAQPEENIKVGFVNADNRSYCQDVATKLPPATPFFYQAEAAGKLAFDGSDFHQKAPAIDRQNKLQTQWIRLFVSNDSNTQQDVTNIYFNPDKFTAEYNRGYDVAKLSTSAAQPLLWTNMPYGEMAFTALPDTLALQPIPLTVYADKAGEYNLYIEDNDYLERLDNLWLFDMQTGTYTDLLLRDRTVELSAGTNSSRFYLQAVFKSKSVATGVDAQGATNSSNADTTLLQPRKVMIDGYFYIIMPDGRIYDGHGKVVKW